MTHTAMEAISYPLAPKGTNVLTFSLWVYQEYSNSANSPKLSHNHLLPTRHIEVELSNFR